MIYELEPDEFERTRSVFAPLDYNLAINSIIKGNTHARIFVNDPEIPRTAFMRFKGKAWLAGCSGNKAFNDDLRTRLSETYYQTLKNRGATWFRLHYGPLIRETDIDAVFQDLTRVEEARHYYHLDAGKQTWNATVPEGYELKLVDSDLLSNKCLENLEDVVEEMQSERLTVGDFLSKSFGCVILQGRKIVGWCMSEHNSDNRCEFGIAMMEAYRRRGLATLTAKATIRHALDLGINEIGWHCSAENEASIATAKKLGFSKKHDYKVYRISLGHL